jgi:ATP-dependent protease ClpP protease subunit
MLHKNNVTKPTDEYTKTLFIIGDVNSNMCSEIVTDLFETDWSKYKELAIYICSDGGCLHSCFAMIDAINFVRDTYQISVTTFGLGEAASAGFFLLCVGDKRLMFPNCMVFVHEHLTIGDGTISYSERKREDKDQDRLYNMYIKYTAERLEISKTRVKGLLKKNRYLTESELVKYNVLTKNGNYRENNG